MAGGRPTAFKPEYVEQAFNLALLGATNQDLARAFKVSDRTIERWLKSEAEFCRALNEGREQADATVSKRLYSRALGYSHKATKIFLRASNEQPVYAEYIEHYPPDTTACIFWLKNRQPRKWRDRQEIEHDISDDFAEKLIRARERAGEKS